ncbi:hypothetical protein Bca4012_018816 [Brassica carinata]
MAVSDFDSLLAQIEILERIYKLATCAKKSHRHFMDGSEIKSQNGLPIQCVVKKEKKSKKMMEEDLGCNFDGLNNQIITPLRLKLAVDIYEEVIETAE